ncbi:MAG: hypothetical protein K9K21_00325 [Desulfotignum sp.]|nr:hypothetical protein [Desulfotignum sp.]MCF8112279.1 hypothetical protein [Desulfotignum sp.]
MAVSFAGQKGIRPKLINKKKPQAVFFACGFLIDEIILRQPRQMRIKIIPEIKIRSVCFAKIHVIGFFVNVYPAKPYLNFLVKQLNAGPGCFCLTAAWINQYDLEKKQFLQMSCSPAGSFVHGYEARLL